ncbi:MAG: DUF4440 domain-containing protein [Alphaproteobacteria bacterium]|nr:DUF4440 domain-containing protein [Alphaproteobacteria bacterium]
MSDEELAAAWYAAWNAHDADAIEALYADDVEFSSPFVAALGFGLTGVIFGKTMLRAYLDAALERAPTMAFAPEALCIGARGHTLIYRNQTGVLVAETHELDEDGLITRADASYEAHKQR